MFRLTGILKAAMWSSLAAGVFLAFGWPFLVSRDPASVAFRWMATATLVVFLVALVGLVTGKAIAMRRTRA